MVTVNLDPSMRIGTTEEARKDLMDQTIGMPKGDIRPAKKPYKTALVPQCPKCHKTHLGECRLRTNRKCYNCGKEGHIARDCRSTPAKASVPAPRGRPNARVYTLNEVNVEAGPSTSISGQLPISNLNLYALIDSGATYPFVAK